ncbi:cytochrome-c oxidase, cbb3-type subunit III [Zavarzinia compransoris]|uniref:Cbb3-type cytochrome c oxidase subunit n=1 Tax=Zavarzinia compransoris TaxID=1264899 RepID=A0A317E1H8_9PROT|nr:cytochrome-c oxidase, cbb3-type subunit III [Zavarzinia compransoris]PWR20819.1 cytochrome-c oxidase, cbb3-type subunit III [Zavarzinia compransoris]TDP44345.1 cytochrome c oxidase cbb3-type subunit 3 [Zavarzinia compransoris]
MTEHRKYEIDPVTGSPIHPHSWDGIGELETPPPRWWVLVYLVCIVFALGWWVAYPAWPTISGYTKGLLGFSTRADVAEQIAAAKAAQAPLNDRLAKADYTAIAADPELSAFALAGGKALFGENCAQCHGSGAAGNVGYPNLLDDDWLWGGDFATLQATLEHGIRATTDADTRQSLMPAFGKDGMLTRAQVDDVAAYVLSLSGGAADAAAAERGTQVFADNCASCHGDKGVGLRDTGGPRLDDAIWLYHGDVKSVAAQIWNPRHGVMPAWAGRLDPLAIKKLVYYVHSLGGGE